MLTPSFAYAVLCFVLLLLFFSGLPNLKTCELPHSLKKNEPDRQNRLAVMIVTILYAICAFWNLGNTRSPQTFVPMEGRDVILRLPENCLPERLVLFPGVGQGNYSIEYSNDAEGWYPQKTFTQDHVAVLKWQFLPLEMNEPVNFLRIHCTSGTPWLGEVALLNPAGNAIASVSSIPELTDEGMLVPSASDFMNSTYFDEIYHARTAWEHLHGIWPYEISHPPLGNSFSRNSLVRDDALRLALLRHFVRYPDAAGDVSLFEASVRERESPRFGDCAPGCRLPALCPDADRHHRQLCRVLHSADV